MAKNFLVDRYIEDARLLLAAADEQSLQLSIAFWFFSEGHQNWRLVVAGQQLDEMLLESAGIQESYTLLDKALEIAQPERLQLSDIQVQHTTSKLVMAVQEQYTISLGDKPVWLESFVYNSSYVDGMVILRSIKPLEEKNG